jgi:hypothetical protein
MTLFTIDLLFTDLDRYYCYEPEFHQRNEAIQFLFDSLLHVGYQENVTELFKRDPEIFNILSLPDNIVEQFNDINNVSYDDTNNIVYVRFSNEIVHCYPFGHIEHFFWHLNHLVEGFYHILERLPKN